MLDVFKIVLLWLPDILGFPCYILYKQKKDKEVMKKFGGRNAHHLIIEFERVVLIILMLWFYLRLKQVKHFGKSIFAEI
jgi:hypothetical protein